MRTGIAIAVGRAIYAATRCGNMDCTRLHVNESGWQLLDYQHVADCPRVDLEGDARWHIKDDLVTLTALETGRVLYQQSLARAYTDARSQALPRVPLLG